MLLNEFVCSYDLRTLVKQKDNKADSIPQRLTWASRYHPTALSTFLVTHPVIGDKTDSSAPVPTPVLVQSQLDDRWNPHNPHALVIYELVARDVLLETAKDLDDVGLFKSQFSCTSSRSVKEKQQTFSASNWSPVPSKQRTKV